MSIKHFQVAATENIPAFYMHKAKEAGSNQAGHCDSLLIFEKYLSWEQEQKHFGLCNVPQEGAIGFVMNLSNHWMALLYMNVPASTSSWARAEQAAMPRRLIQAREAQATVTLPLL